ncbi:hypothetical protein J6590_084279 [Homalodisca vitripennis]|nr:hypothetical protein J6590_084279 [Homalodisca vitripennis]
MPMEVPVMLDLGSRWEIVNAEILYPVFLSICSIRSSRRAVAMRMDRISLKIGSAQP